MIKNKAKALSRAGKALEKDVAQRSMGGMLGDPSGVALLGVPGGLGTMGGGMTAPGAGNAPLDPSGAPVGVVPGRAGGGGIEPPGAAPGAAPNPKDMTLGAILSAVPGRTDAHATHVPSGSYVIPADIVSGRGQGNTIAGAEALKRLFDLGSNKPKAPRKSVGMRAKFRQDGGLVTDEMPADDAKPVRVNLAGGEIVVPPENLLSRVHPDLKTAHEIMDAWVVNERKNLRKELGKLPPPVKE